MAGIIDAHQHFWRLARGDYGWLTRDFEPLYRDFMPADLLPLMRANGVVGTVLVQAAPTEAETRFLLDIADAHPFVRGVVGWTDFEAADVPERIAALAAHPRLVGLRPMVQDLGDDDWLLRDDLAPAFRAVVEHDLAFDALVLPRHLPRLAALRDRHPDLRIVVDHGAKPAISDRLYEAWAADIAAIAADGRSVCKLSGLATEAGPEWTPDRLRPYVGHLLECFGPRRLIFGSDWPVLTLVGSYDDWISAVHGYLAPLPSDDRAAVLGGNAVRVYRLDR
ncbi:hydrolase [Thalassobaculum fulvum]|uniref:Hydrolase n=1 Tax=Thalassobaculum fulvum TaxID=1633335 RepID=A0A918XX81_9PROT|nr:amidohydrolase family protein [Thalassobaculum fulvum]GHD62025.1 hydrolase [Thalassobaculum fulvum]